MRTHPGQTALLRDREPEIDVEIGGTSITDLLGQDWLESLVYSGSNDSPIVEFVLKLPREQWDNSMAPLNGDSQLNSPTPFLWPKKAVTVEARESPDQTLEEVLRGRIDTIDWDAETIVIRGRDLAGILQDRWIETPRAYGIGRIPYGVRVWRAGELWAAGEYVTPSQPPVGEASAVFEVVVGGTAGVEEPAWPAGFDEFEDGEATLQRVAFAASGWTAATDFAFAALLEKNSHTLICIRAGESGASEPTWPTGAGETIDDGTCRWAVLPDDSDGLIPIEAILQGIVRDNFGTDVPDLWVPVSPGYWRNAYRVEEQPVLQALVDLAAEIGWTLRLAYDSTATEHETWGKWRLKFFAPPRDKVTLDATFSADDYELARQCSINADDVRNVISIVYSDATDREPAPPYNARRKTIKVEDATSIAKYDRLYMGISAGTSSGIDNATEAAATVAAALFDLKEPNILWAVELLYRWWVEIDDLLGFTADRLHFTTDQALAVAGYSHEISKGRKHTTVFCRGSPGLGPSHWFHQSTGPGASPPAAPMNPMGPTLGEPGAIPNGFVLDFKPPPRDTSHAWPLPKSGQWDHSELHVSEVDGFDLSESTFKAASRGTRFVVDDLTPGTTYYGRVVNVDKLGNHSPPSAQFEIAAGHLQLGTLDPGLQVLASAQLTEDVAEMARDEAVALDKANVDPLGIFDSGALVIPTGATGIYRVRGVVGITGLSAGDAARVTVVEATAGEVAAGPPIYATGSSETAAMVDAIVALDAGASVTLVLDCSGTGSVGVAARTTRLEVERLLG